MWLSVICAPRAQITESRKDGRTQFVSVKSLAGEPCIIVADISNPTFHGKRNFNVDRLTPGTYRIDLKAGEEVVIRESDDTGECVITPQPARQSNLFGKKHY